MANVIEVHGTQQEERTLRASEASAGLPETFCCLLAVLDKFHCAAKSQEPQSCLHEIRRVSSALCVFLRTLVPAAPSDVVDDIVYIVVLYLMKESMECGSQEAHALAENYTHSEHE